MGAALWPADGEEGDGGDRGAALRPAHGEEGGRRGGAVVRLQTGSLTGLGWGHAGRDPRAGFTGGFGHGGRRGPGKGWRRVHGGGREG